MLQTQLPSGLDALMPQMAPKIPPGLLALIQQTQTLKQVSQPVVPETGQLTVAAKAAQAAEQMISPSPEMSQSSQGNSPPGIAALMPGVKQQAMNMAQAAQPATRGDVQQAMRSALGGLPGDVRMAQGGIVGYAGPDGSDVKLDETNLPINERFKRDLRRLYERIESGYMQRAGATPEQIAKKLGTEAPTPVAPIPEGSDRRLDIPVGGIVSPGMATSAPAPAPVDRKKRAPAPAPAPAPSAPIETMMDTRNIPMPPSESSVASAEAERIARESAEEQRKPRAKTPEEIAAEAEQKRLTQSGIASLETQRQRFEEAEAARKAGLSNQQRENLISFLTRVGGAGSLLGGFAQASRGMEPIIAGQRAAEQAANEKKLQYFDLLDQRKDAVERLNLAWLQKDAEKAMAESARIRGIDADLAKTLAALKADEAKQRLVGEQAMARTQADNEARAREGEANRKNALQVEGIRSAARTAGAEGRGALTPRDIARLRAQAEKDVDAQLGKDPRYVSMKVRDPVGAATYRTTTIDERLKRVLAEEGYGGAAPSPPPDKTYNFADIGGPK